MNNFIFVNPTNIPLYYTQYKSLFKKKYIEAQFIYIIKFFYLKDKNKHIVNGLSYVNLNACLNLDHETKQVEFNKCFHGFSKKKSILNTSNENI